MIRKGFRRSLCAALLLAASLLRPGQTPAAPAQQPTAVAARSFFTSEVRLRKLHLVRPDLIPYPINFEIFC